MLWIPIDRTSNLPLIRQIYSHIRKCILDGQLNAGEKLPSTRALSTELDVSRNVILEAYDQLLAEGFLVARQGSGTFIAEGAFLERNTNMSSSNLIQVKTKKRDLNSINFRSGMPALDFFPRNTWARLAHNIWNEAASSAFGYDIPEGRLELRQALSHYLLKTRGVDCRPEQIVITSGATQALTLVSKLFLSAKDTVIMEDPITDDIQTIFKTSGASLYPVPVDKDGMQTSLLPLEQSPKFVFVTPSHQFPLGGILPIQRRIQLINYARKTNCYLVEDDYDSEFRYEGSPISSLQGLAPERVIYIGSFSKILSPALRMGYLVLPSQLIETCRKLKWFSDLHTPSIEQLVLARFMEEGYLHRHISKMKKIYKSRRDFIINCLKKKFSNQINISGYSTGLHLIIELTDVYFTKELLKEINESGVEIYPVEDHTIEKGKHCTKLILGYGHLKKEEIEEGINRLYQAIVHN